MLTFGFIGREKIAEVAKSLRVKLLSIRDMSGLKKFTLIMLEDVHLLILMKVIVVNKIRMKRNPV